MATGELEPAAPGKRRRRKAPPAPARVPDVLQSYKDDMWYSRRSSTREEAVQISREILSAVHWLRTWQDLDVRASPYVREYFVVDGDEVEVRDDGRKRPSRYEDHFWRTHFYVHPPIDTGNRVASAEGKLRSQRAAQAAIRKAREAASQPPRRRTVQIRREALRLAVQAPWPLIRPDNAQFRARDAESLLVDGIPDRIAECHVYRDDSGHANHATPLLQASGNPLPTRDQTSSKVCARLAQQRGETPARKPSGSVDLGLPGPPHYTRGGQHAEDGDRPRTRASHGHL